MIVVIARTFFQFSHNAVYIHDPADIKTRRRDAVYTRRLVGVVQPELAVHHSVADKGPLYI